MRMVLTNSLICQQKSLQLLLSILSCNNKSLTKDISKGMVITTIVLIQQLVMADAKKKSVKPLLPSLLILLRKCLKMSTGELVAK